MQRLGAELTKEEYVIGYMKNFKRLVLMADYEKKLTPREEQLLECEKEGCVLFYEQFVEKHNRAPDKAILDDQVKTNFLVRSKIFARAPTVIDEENFVQLYLSKIKNLREMRREAYAPDNYTHILEREKELAIRYFRKYDSYPYGYEFLLISRSHERVTQGIERLLEEFRASYQAYYRKYRRNI